MSSVNNLEEFPIVNCISLPQSVHRHDYMKKEAERYNLKLNLSYAYDGVNNNVYDLVNVEGFSLYSMNNGEICTVLSHLRAIKHWLESTDESYGFFCEDDVLLALNESWGFKWSNFIESLPPNWATVQLSLIREDLAETVETYARFHQYVWDNWSACAYIVSRSYAEHLIKTHCVAQDTYNLLLPYYPTAIPYVENVLYSLKAKEESYTFPLFVENVEFNSTFYPKFIDQTNKNFQNTSSHVIQEWWKTRSKLLTLKQLMQ